MIAYNFSRSEWEILTPDKESPIPQSRAGHSAIVYDGKMYIFGGKDEDNEKLKDLWCFEFETRMWKQLPSDDEEIVSRSGHSAQVYNEYMLIFGGIHEVTSELDDMMAFNLKTN